MQTLISKIVGKENLSRAEAERAMEDILSGRATEAEIVALLTALRTRRSSVDELVGFATAMRRAVQPIFDGTRPAWAESLVDTCGTGGTGRNTINISTCAAFVVAGAGVRVAKHGNRSLTSKCGSADVLEALGVNLNLPPARIAHCLETIGIGFLFAPALHPAMKYAMPARRALGGRTIFNLLGPLTNPAGARIQVIGVNDGSLTELMARALGEMGAKRAMVVHGADGLDEISLSGETKISEWKDGAVKTYAVTPEDFGLKCAPLSAIAGGNAAVNAASLQRVLDGEKGPHKDVVLMNAAAALVAAGAANDFRDGIQKAARSLESGSAKQKLTLLIDATKDWPQRH
ncbi:MAG: anthranilate phosphoribosyltransferase [Acidobacteria bacterium]|nr:anthranilate phosphoribosyltransferase [Acidobacteriota bacterium]